MDLPKISSGMLDGLKSRFGRGKAGNDPYGGGFDDYDDDPAKLDRLHETLLRLLCGQEAV